MGKRPDQHNQPYNEVTKTEWEALLGAAVDAIIVIDHLGVIETFNGAAERLFGYGSEEVLGRNVSMLMPEPYHSQHDRFMRDYRETGQRKIIGIGREALGKRKDGTIVPIDLSVGEAKPTGSSSRFVGIVRDISENKQAMQALRNEHELNQSYLDLAQVIIVNLDCAGCITMINRKGLELLEYEEGELLGRDWFDVCVAPKFKDKSRRIFDSLLAGSPEQIDFFENPIQTKTKEIKLVEWRNALVRDAEGNITGTMSSGLDLTERRQTEEEVRQARERLSQFGRLSTIGEMAAGLAHEINQPLTAIAAYTQACRRLLEAGRMDAQELLDTTGKINTQALRAGEVIGRLRKFVRHTDTGRKRYDCHNLVREVVTLAELDAKAHNVSVVLHNRKTALFVNVDEVQIQQVILNLIRNAIDSMLGNSPEDRTIEIDIAEDKNEMIRISVCDLGSGIANEVEQRLFDPFFTTKKSGMGLGLPMCRSIVDAHGGILSFERNKTMGTTFYFTLPSIRGETDDD